MMLKHIRDRLLEMLKDFPSDDSIIFNNDTYVIDKQNFFKLFPLSSLSDKKVAFVDGGQAEILAGGNFSLSFIRIFAQVFENMKKKESYRHEFYLLTRARWMNDDIFYESQIFSLGENLIDPADLLVSSNDNSLKEGKERASVSKIANLARRLAELSLASKISAGNFTNISADYVVLDGTLQATFPGEEKYLSLLKENCCSLAKSSTLLTKSGNSPIVLLNRIGPEGCWSYHLNPQTRFVKLNQKSKHVFRFEGNKEVLPLLLEQSNDSLLLGYPYGLIYADKMARVSNQEKKSLQMKILLRKESKEILDYLSTTDVHGFLDTMG